ncbi:MAG: RNA polymerase sigma factor [Kiloniellales bacterium]
MNEVYREIEQHIPHLRRYARAIAHNPVAADDLVQESLLRALTKSHLYRPGTNLRAWLFTILHNQHVSDVRRNARTGVAVDPDDAAPALATRPNQETGLVIGALQRALQQLPDKQRILIELVALGDMSYEEVAKSYGLPLGTVKSRISRGRTQLRDALEGRSRLSRSSYPNSRTRRAVRAAA